VSRDLTQRVQNFILSCLVSPVKVHGGYLQEMQTTALVVQVM